MRDRAQTDLRRARVADALPLLRLIEEHAAFERSCSTISLADLTALLSASEPPTAILVAEKGGELLGYAALTFDYSLWRASRYAHLDCLFVRAECRGMAIGAQLLSEARQMARQTGARRLEGQTPEWNDRGIAFYKREGASTVKKVRFIFASEDR